MTIKELECMLQPLIDNSSLGEVTQALQNLVDTNQKLFNFLTDDESFQLTNKILELKHICDKLEI